MGLSCSWITPLIKVVRFRYALDSKSFMSCDILREG